MQCEQSMLYDKAIYRTDWQAARVAANNMAAINLPESKYMYVVELTKCMWNNVMILIELPNQTFYLIVFSLQMEKSTYIYNVLFSFTAYII